MAKDLTKYFREMETHYLTTDLLHTMGCDFNFANAHQDYKNMDILFGYINDN